MNHIAPGCYIREAKFGLIKNTLLKAHTLFWKARIDPKYLQQTLNRCGVSIRYYRLNLQSFFKIYQIAT